MEYIVVNGLTKSYKVINTSENKRKKIFFNDYKSEILSGILRPDEGTCTVDGQIPWDNRKKYVRDVGVMFGQRSQLLWDLTPLDSFELLRRIYKVGYEQYKDNLKLLVDMLNLQGLLSKNVREMSLGQRIRCELAATFIHGPRLVFLDEPTLGIDIEVKRKFHEFIKEINAMKQVTVFVTTHDLDDIESICNHLMIINNGELYYNDTIEELLKYEMPGMVEVELIDAEERICLPHYAKLIEGDGKKYKIFIEDNKLSGELIGYIAAKNNIRNIYAEKPRIEDIIHKIYTGFAQT